MAGLDPSQLPVTVLRGVPGHRAAQDGHSATFLPCVFSKNSVWLFPAFCLGVLSVLGGKQQCLPCWLTPSLPPVPGGRTARLSSRVWFIGRVTFWRVKYS